MFRIIVKDVNLHGYAQPLALEVEVLGVSFSPGQCTVQYAIRPEPTSEEVRGELPVLKEGFTSFPTPAPLEAAIKQTFEAMVHPMLGKLAGPPDA